jgi:hypothetical protein
MTVISDMVADTEKKYVHYFGRYISHERYIHT